MPPVTAIGLGAADLILSNDAEGDAEAARLGALDRSDALQREYMDKSLAAQKENFERSIAEYRAGVDRGTAAITGGFNQARADLLPLVDAQKVGIAQLQGLADPNSLIYQQQRDANTKAIQRQLAAQGLLRSKSQVDLLGNLELGLNQQRQGAVGALAGLGGIERTSALNANLGLSTGNLQAGLGNQLGSAYQGYGNNLAGTYQGYGNAFANTALARGDVTANAELARAQNVSNWIRMSNNAIQQYKDQAAQAFAMYGGGMGGGGGGGAGGMGSMFGGGGGGGEGLYGGTQVAPASSYQLQPFQYQSRYYGTF